MYVRSLIIAGLLLLPAPGAVFADRTPGVSAEAVAGMTGVVEAVNFSGRMFRLAGRVFFVPEGVAEFERLAPQEMVTVYWKPGEQGPEVLSLEFAADQ